MWDWKRIAIFSIPFMLIAISVIVWLFMRKTLRSRRNMERQLREDPDINEWLVVFGWSRKILYLPMVLSSVIACILMYIGQAAGWGPAFGHVVGGIWLGVFVLNFLVDEYEMSVKVLVIALLCVVLLCLWLVALDWFVPFLRFFRNLRFSLSAQGYLILALLFLLAIGVAWLKGLFYYVAITPNYLNIQVGPTETGEQVSREEYSTRIDTGDFLERMLGFGRIVVTFADQRRQPMLLLVGRIGPKAAKLESIRGKLAVDRYQPHRENGIYPAGQGSQDT